MSDLLPVAGPALISVRDERTKHSAPDAELLVDQLTLNWPIIVFRIMVAGGAYPTVLAIGFLLLGVIHFPRELGEMVLATLFGAAVGCAVGMILAAAVILVTLPLMYAFVWSLKLRGSIIWLSASYGGLVGFVAVLPFVLQVPMFGDVSGIGVLLALLIGPGLTTILGQLGGAWGGWRVGWYQRASLFAKRKELPESHDRPQVALDAVADSLPQPRFQFRIYHLLWLGVWVSLLLTAIRLSGFPYHSVLPILIGWLIYQAATLWIGGVLMQRIMKWRAERQIRST